ncbi:hypothetical protein HKX48_002109 [Thoreauomyces humboldtii]|nr:hypothetical protein HKX48_002109 [Thoreauomyces humboldtii]
MPLPDPLAGFPDFEAHNELIKARLSPGEHARNDCDEGPISDPRVPDWDHLDADDRFDRLVARFLRNPAPKTVHERRFGLRFLQRVNTTLSYEDAYEPEDDNPARDQFIDFDVLNGTVVRHLRIAYNDRTDDGNTGRYFSVRDRDDASRLLAWSFTPADLLHDVECVDRAFMDAWANVPALAPIALAWSPNPPSLDVRSQFSWVCVCGELHKDYYESLAHKRLVAAGVSKDDREVLTETIAESLNKVYRLINGHQCEALFAIASSLDWSDFETVGNVPKNVRKLLNLILVRRGLGKLLPEDILQIIASWLELPTVH